METEQSLGVEADAEAKFPLPIDETITPQLQPKNKDFFIFWAEVFILAVTVVSLYCIYLLCMYSIHI